MGILRDTAVSRKVPHLIGILLKSVWDIKGYFKIDRVFSRTVHAWYVLHNILTWTLTKSLDYNNYFYRQLLRKFLFCFVLFCFVFPLEWLNSVLIFGNRWKDKKWREQSYIEMKYDSKILCNSFFWYCSSFRCSLSLFFTLCLQSERCERLREQRIILNVFPFFTWTSLFLSAIQLMSQEKVLRPTTQPHDINTEKTSC